MDVKCKIIVIILYLAPDKSSFFNLLVRRYPDSFSSG